VDIAVNDWSTGEELFHYDLAVLCPPRFNATFYLPRRALAAGTTNRSFHVVLDDAVKRYQVYLTAVKIPSQRDGDSQEQSSEVTSAET